MGEPLSTLGGPLRPGIVHRLDAGTSGLMVVACTDRAHEALRAMLEGPCGRPPVPGVRARRGEHEAFTVDAPARPAGRQAGRRCTRRARPAETAFEVRERFDGLTLLEAIPKTGRTHQIRVHLQAIGHPIVGDRAYGGGGDAAERLGLQRPFLHSWRIAFDHR